MKFIKYVVGTLVVIVLALLVFGVISLFFDTNYVKDGTYVSHYGHFKFKIPSSMSQGGNRDDGRHFVRFTNDWCELYRIDYGEIPEVEKPVLAKHGREKFEEYFLRDVYVNMFLQPRLPEGKINVDFVEYRSDVHGGSLYAQLNMPNGSVCEAHENGVLTGRDDAKRALLVVIKDDKTYVITTTLNVALTGFGGAGTSAPLSRKVWSNSLRDKLKYQTLGFANSIEFF